MRMPPASIQRLVLSSVISATAVISSLRPNFKNWSVPKLYTAGRDCQPVKETGDEGPKLPLCPGLDKGFILGPPQALPLCRGLMFGCEDNIAPVSVGGIGGATSYRSGTRQRRRT